MRDGIYSVDVPVFLNIQRFYKPDIDLRAAATENKN
jgi:hypothetical protein